jgi:stringent starvation protein B
METGTPASKQELLESLLERGMVMITLDARRPGVDVPAHFADDPRLRLNLSYRFQLPLDMNEWGVRASLTFGGMPHECKMPWNSVYQMYSHATKDQFLFPADVPEDLVQATLAQGEDTATPIQPSQAQPAAKSRPRFTVVEGSVQDSEPGVGSNGPEEPPPEGAPKRPHLRRIK